MKTHFFLGKLYQQLFCLTLSLHWWYSIPSLVLFGQLHNPMKKTFFNIPFSRNSKSSIWKHNFFPRQAKPKILFALHCNYTGDTQYRVWFDLDNSLTRWKRIFFLNSRKFAIREIRKIPYENPFFSRQAIPTTFLTYTVLTLVILNTECGLIWTTH